MFHNVQQLLGFGNPKPPADVGFGIGQLLHDSEPRSIHDLLQAYVSFLFM